MTEGAVRNNPEATVIVRHLGTLIGQLRRQWIPATKLPMRLVHGDVKVRNIVRGANGRTVYLNFGLWLTVHEFMS